MCASRGGSLSITSASEIRIRKPASHAATSRLQSQVRGECLELEVNELDSLPDAEEDQRVCRADVSRPAERPYLPEPADESRPALDDVIDGNKKNNEQKCKPDLKLLESHSVSKIEYRDSGRDVHVANN